MKPLYFKLRKFIKKMCGGIFSFLKLAHNASGINEVFDLGDSPHTLKYEAQMLDNAHCSYEATKPPKQKFAFIFLLPAAAVYQ